MGDSIPKWARAARPGSYVEAKHADGTLQKVLFEGKRGVVFGRNGQVCDIEVAHKSASRVHACLAFDGADFQIQDLASSHGTFVNGARLEKSAKAEMVPGKSVITIGRCTTEYTLQSPTADTEGPHDRQERENRRCEVPAPAGPSDYSGREKDRERGEHEASREHAHRVGRDADRPCSREDSREAFRDRRSHEADHRRQDGHRGSRGEHLGRDWERGWGRGRGRGSGGYRHGGDSRDYRLSDDRASESHGRRHARSPEGQRRRRGRDSEEEKDERQATAAEERRRKRKSGFDDGSAAAAAAAPGPQQTSAQIVMGMMGAGGTAMPTGMLNVEQKKKLLWGKKAEPVEAEPVTQAFGANRWDTAEFINESEKEKFIKLMGVKKVPTVPTAAMAQAQPASLTEREALTREKQDRLLHDVESQFMAGLRRADGRTVGLGL